MCQTKAKAGISATMRPQVTLALLMLLLVFIEEAMGRKKVNRDWNIPSPYRSTPDQGTLVWEKNTARRFEFFLNKSKLCSMTCIADIAIRKKTILT